MAKRTVPSFAESTTLEKRKVRIQRDGPAKAR